MPHTLLPSRLAPLAAIDRAAVCPELLMPTATAASLVRHVQMVALVGERATIAKNPGEPPNAVLRGGFVRRPLPRS